MIEAEIDLPNTLESGQTFRWQPTDRGYQAVVDGKVVEAWSTQDGLRYRTTGLREERVSEVLGLGDPLDDIHDSILVEPRVRQAVHRYGGMRVVNEEFFPTLVSFIISAQNNIPRITNHVQDIACRYGEPLALNGDTVHSFPRPEELAVASEEELRGLGLGYRAPYLKESARMVADGEVDPREIHGMDYHDAHEEIQRLVGVGDKVADCVLLFSLDFHEAVPIDTWIARTIEDYYPELSGDSYMETADNFRERFGGQAGYAQNYLFHYIRHHG